MQGKNRGTEEISAFCKKYKDYCETVEAQANQLMIIAQTAESNLRDEVGKKAIDGVYDFCNKVINIVCQGKEPILELEKRNRQDEEDMENLRGRFR